MEALNRAIDGADAFTKMMDRVTMATPPAPRNISAEVAAWNAKVDREKFEKKQMKRIERRSAAERLQTPI